MSGALNKVTQDKLALLGGPKVLQEPMPLYSSFGSEEKAAAIKVIESGVLSKFIGAWTSDFYGGEQVQAFEKAWSDYFKVKHSVSVNSATSGLICALGALDLEPGDEVICSPWTMSADGAAILVWNAIPVFADIEDRTFGLCPQSIRKNITKRTKAILVSDIHGHAAQLDEIMKIACEHKLKVIEDAAQAPGAMYKGKFVGTIADIGVFSLNYHKHIHTGEGGVCVTNDSSLAERMQLIRNHAESVVSKKGVTSINNMIGFNFRLGEIEAAMGTCQLHKLSSLALSRTRACLRLIEGMKHLSGIRMPIIEKDCTHVFYTFPMILDLKKLGVQREQIAKALRAEGVPVVMEGYVNVHLLPTFQQKIAYGTSGFPWKMGSQVSEVSYVKGICPVAEKFHAEEVIQLTPCSHRYNDEDVDLVIAAFKKVWENLSALKGA